MRFTVNGGIFTCFFAVGFNVRRPSKLSPDGIDFYSFAYSAARKEVRLYDNALVRSIIFIFKFFHNDIKRYAAKLVRMRVYCCQRRIQIRRHGNIVCAQYGKVIRYFIAAFLQSLYSAYGDIIVCAYEGSGHIRTF